MRKKSGFTLIELLVAMAAASVVSLSALQMYGLYHHLVVHQVQSYHRESGTLLQRAYDVIPYKRKIPGLSQGLNFRAF